MDTKDLEALSDDAKWRVVYEIWASDGQQNDVTTSELTGIPRSSINYHRNRESWSRRFREERLGLSGADLDVARIRWRRMLVEGQARMEDIVSGRKLLRDPFGKLIRDEEDQPISVWSSKDSDAVAAYKAIMETVTNRDIGNQVESYEGTIASISEGSEVEDPALLATKILEEIAGSVNTRPMMQARRGRRV